MKTRLVTTESVNPWHNLALEKLLYTTCGQEVILFLWQNDNTVVIGRNQNVWKECALDLMERDHVVLARRESGGGAVFHDLGNLNFTFISPLSVHDVPKQLGVIQSAAARFGIETDYSSRNDLVIRLNGGKFSGNAFQRNVTHALHHGTILINADTEKAALYLTPPARKIEAKGIDSVRSRICNLKTIETRISVSGMIEALMSVFEDTYGKAEKQCPFVTTDPRLSEYESILASWDWRIGKTPAFNLTLENRFSWGGIEILLNVKRGIISEAVVYSDALDETLAGRIASALQGLPLAGREISAGLASLNGPGAEDLATWVSGLDI